MKQEKLYNSFLEAISQKIPQKGDVVNVLANILCIGKEAVYRRLRGEVSFTFYEVMTISRQLHISLDNLEMNTSLLSKPFKLNLIEYINPAESDFALLEEMTNIMKSFENVPNPEVGEITNILPQPLYIPYESIFKFYLFKWKYQSNTSNKAIPYNDIVIVDKLRETQNEYVEWAKRLDTEYIFDKQLFQYLVTNIKYFYEIGLISKEEIRIIIEDLSKIVDDIDLCARTGILKETGKKINIYISNINIDTNYIFVGAKEYQLTIIKAFLLNGIASTDKRTFEETKIWMKSTKRQSILITGSGDRERINFIEEQYDIIQSLSRL